MTSLDLFYLLDYSDKLIFDWIRWIKVTLLLSTKHDFIGSLKMVTLFTVFDWVGAMSGFDWLV
jgi:hypothetical protein